MRRIAVGTVSVFSLLAAGCGSEGVPTAAPTTSTAEPTATSTTQTTIPPTTTTTEAPAPVVATTSDGQAVPAPVLATAQQIYRAASAQDLTILGTLAAAPDFTYSFGDPPGDPVAFWSADPVASTEAMTRVLEQSVATDGTDWWWPAEWLTDETYYDFRIGIDNAGTWQFAVEGD